MFSFLTLHNCVISEDGAPTPIILNSTVRFPSRRWNNSYQKVEPTVTTWAARPVTDVGHLDLTLNVSKIAEGAIGLVCATHLNAGIDGTGQNIPSEWPTTAPRELCVKIAMPGNCRSLAREAWFYEQLSEVQGIATAKCYVRFYLVVALGLTYAYYWKFLHRTVQDISDLGIIHCNITAFNFLWAPAGHRKHCPRHNTEHRWRIVDFSNADMIDHLHSAVHDLNDAKDQGFNIGDITCEFWGQDEDFYN